MLSQFFLFCSGVNATLLKRTPTDKNKYEGIGATIFFTGCFAAIAAGFAIYSSFQSVFASLIFGLFWGLLIFNLDRYIVMSLKKKNESTDWLRAIPRLTLAVLIAFVISKPLELKLFESEIDAELVLMEQEVRKLQENALNSRFDYQIDTLKSEISRLELQIKESRNTRDKLSAIAIAEADGTGGSMKRNLGPIYQAKLNEAQLAQVELDQLQAEIQPIIDGKRKDIATVEHIKTEKLAELKAASLNGLAAQIDALGRLSSKSSTIWWTSLFISLLFIAIETAPIFTKLISSRSPYDFHLNRHEAIFENRSYFENLQIQSSMSYEQQVSDYQLESTIIAERELIKASLQKELQSLKESPKSWQEYLRGGRYFGSINR